MTNPFTALFFASTLILISPLCAAQPETSVDIEFLGEYETVVSWKRDKCEDIDIPDAGLRVFRRFDGRVIALASHYVARTLVGSNVLSLTKNGCRVSFRSHHNADPEMFDDETWLAATWTDDGINIAAIGHNEYHGEMHAGMCSGKTPRECRYGVLTLLSSNNSGDSFSLASLRPIAAAPTPQTFNQRHDTGFFQPSNIFAHDGMKYVFVRTSGGGTQTPAACLMRARSPLEPDS